MRLLDGTRPEVDLRQLVVPAVPGEELLRRPRLQHELDRLTPALALLDRGHAVADVRVAAEAQRQTCDEPAAADAVEHRVLLGDPDRGRGRGDGRAELDE